MPVTADDLEQEFQEEQNKKAQLKAKSESNFNESSGVLHHCRWVLAGGVTCGLIILLSPVASFRFQHELPMLSEESEESSRKIMPEVQPDAADLADSSEELMAHSILNRDDFGKGGFAQHIDEFLSTASRTPLNPDLCSKMRLAFGSQCPTWKWLNKYHGPEVEQRPAVFVDIGCNKGYSTADFYEHFAPTSGISKKELFKLHSNIGTPKACGVCQDCKDKGRFGKPVANPQAPIVYCIDGSPITHKNTKRVAEILKKDNPQGQGWELLWQAMTNKTGFITYEDCGTESCGIDRGTFSKKVKVPAFSYDDFAESKGIVFADLVKLDVEGEEPLVIQGMHRSLQAHKVGFLAFEIQGYSVKGWFPYFDFRRLVDLLDAYGYDCYVDSAQGGIALLTGCDSARFAQAYSNAKKLPKWYTKMKGVIPQWGNGICGLRANAEIRSILNGMSQPAHPAVPTLE